MNKKEFKKWATSFSVKILKLITILWASFLAYSAIVMTIAIFQTGQLVSLDTFISEVSETFRDAVVAILITRTVSNIFEFNNGGLFGTSMREENNE